jgi:hypothetical protein
MEIELVIVMTKLMEIELVIVMTKLMEIELVITDIVNDIGHGDLLP